MKTITTLDLDLAKHYFSAYGVCVSSNPRVPGEKTMGKRSDLHDDIELVAGPDFQGRLDIDAPGRAR